MFPDVVLDVQRAVQGGPAVVDLPDAVPVRQPDVAVVADVGRLVADGGQRLPLEARRAGRHQEHGQALVLGQRRVGPGDQEHVLRVLGVGGEDLLPVDDPLVAVADRPGLRPGDVRPAVRLGVAQAETDLSAGHLRLQLITQPRVRVRVDRWPRQLLAHLGRRVPPGQFVLEDLDAHVVQFRAAVFLRPSRHQPALGAQGQDQALVEVFGLARGPRRTPRGSGAHRGTPGPPRRTPAEPR